MNNDRLKFRVWDKSLKTYYNQKTHILFEDGFLGEYDFGEVNQEKYIVEMCTGLRDKKGNLIFEGDIIQAPNTPQKYIITWGHHGFISTCGCHSYPMSGTDLFEIIGNIHEQKDGE